MLVMVLGVLGIKMLPCLGWILELFGELDTEHLGQSCAFLECV